MSGETEQQQSGWTTDTLKAHYDTRLDEMDLRYQHRYDAQQKALEAALTAAEKAVTAALAAAEKAVTKAESAAEKRFEAVNEFRGQLADQAATLVSRVEFTTATNALAEKVDDLKKSRDRFGGGQAALVIAATTLISLVVVLVKFL